MSVTQMNIAEAIKELVNEIRKKELKGSVILDFDSGNLVNISIKQNIGAKNLVETFYFKKVGLGVLVAKEE